MTPEQLTALGSGLSGLGSLVSTGYNMFAGFGSQSYASREAAAQRAWQEKMWNMQNEYNKPINQRRRLEEAGLNPYLMMNGASAGQSQSLPSGAAAIPPSPPYMQQNPLSHVSDTLMQLGNLKAQNAQARKADSETQLNNIESQFRATKLSEEIQNIKSGRYKNEMETMLLNFQKSLAAEQLQFNWASHDNRVTEQFNNTEYQRQQINLAAANVKNSFLQSTYQEIQNKFAPKQFDAELRYTLAKCAEAVQAAKETSMRAQAMYSDSGYYPQMSKGLFGSKGYYQYLKNNLFHNTQNTKAARKGVSAESNAAAKYAEKKAAATIDNIEMQTTKGYWNIGSDYINAGANFLHAASGFMPWATSRSMSTTNYNAEGKPVGSTFTTSKETRRRKK